MDSAFKQLRATSALRWTLQKKINSKFILTHSLSVLKEVVQEKQSDFVKYIFYKCLYPVLLGHNQLFSFFGLFLSFLGFVCGWPLFCYRFRKNIQVLLSKTQNESNRFLPGWCAHSSHWLAFNRNDP